MTDIEALARAEAEKRAAKSGLPHIPIIGKQTAAGMIETFVAGAVWAASRPVLPAAPPSVEVLAKAIYDAVWAHLYETYMTPDQARRVAATVLGSDVFAPARQCQESADLDIRGDEIPATGETVTEEMVERAARAIHDAHHPVEGPVPEWDSDSDEWRSTYRDFARAALEAALTEGKVD